MWDMGKSGVGMVLLNMLHSKGKNRTHKGYFCILQEISDLIEQVFMSTHSVQRVILYIVFDNDR